MTLPLPRAGWRLLVVSLLGCTACHGNQTNVRGPPRILIPKGCEANLSGPYLHAKSPSFRYLGEDDGGTLVLYVRREGMDGGTGMVADPGNTRVVLTRSNLGFVGQTLSVQPNALQTPCPVTLPTPLVACDAAGITLKTLDRTAVDEQCRAPATGPLGSLVDERLLRPPPTRP